MKIVFNSDEETMLNCSEVVTLSSKNQFLSIWNGDIIVAHLRNGYVYKGSVVWSIETWRICVEYSPGNVISFDKDAIEYIEILNYSDLRAMNDRGDTGIIEELRCKLINRLEAVSDSYPKFIEETWRYARTSMERYNKVIGYLNENPNATTVDIMKFLMEQPDFFD